jgi:DNA-binding transcriptional MocR family regulator
VKALGRILRSLSPDELGEAVNYAPSGGLLELRRILAVRNRQLIPLTSVENFVVTSGCSEAIALTLWALVPPPAVITVESPTHFGTLQMLRDRGYNVLEVPVDPRCGMLPDDLEAALRSRSISACLLTPSVHNPTGATMNDDQKKEVLEILAHHGIPVVEDDIYGEMVHRGARPRPLGHWAQEYGARVVTCSSYSKVLAPGFRIGWAVGRDDDVRKIRTLKAGMSLAAPTLQQMVIARYLEGGGFDRHLNRLRSVVAKQVGDYAAAVSRFFPEGTRLAPPGGGNFLWVELPLGCDAREVHRLAREAGIAIVPGQAFSATGGYTNFMRISAPGPLDDRTKKALAQLGEIVDRSVQLSETSSS